MPSFIESLPPDLYDTTTLVSLASTLAILGAAYTLSLWALDRTTTSGTTRFLFIWHAFDALLHFTLEGSFLYHCFFSWVNIADVADPSSLAPSPDNFLGHKGRAYGPQAGGDNPFAMLWMVYANADWRWAGADLTIISLELLTVFLAGPLACLICYGLAKRDPRTNIVMIIVATMELYGGFLTFCPEWLTGNTYLDSSNWMYLWLYLVFFNTVWVFIPIYVLGVASLDVIDAFKVRAEVQGGRKTQ